MIMMMMTLMMIMVMIVVMILMMRIATDVCCEKLFAFLRTQVPDDQAGTSCGDCLIPNFILKLRIVEFSRHLQLNCRKSFFLEQKQRLDN